MRAGAGRSIITPPLPVQLAGHRGPRVAVEVADELEARALVVQEGDRLAALIAVDLLWLGRPHVKRIREIVESVAGVPQRATFVACTHTHSGPDTLDWYDFAPPVDPGWLAVLFRNIASAAYVASRRLGPARVRRATSHVEIGVNRRLPTPRGVERHPNAAGPVDHGLDVVSLTRPDGSVVANVICQGTHPVVLGAASLAVSADWCGVASRTVESAVGGVCLCLNGACGDVNPTTWTNASLDDVRRIGLRVGSAAVEAVLREEPAPFAGGVAVLSEEVSVGSHPHPYLLRAQRARLEQDGAMVVEAQALRLGSAVFVGLPGECLVDTARAVAERTGLGRPIVVSFANDYVGYLPLPEVIAQGGYEARTRMLDEQGIVACVDAAARVARSVCADADARALAEPG